MTRTPFIIVLVALLACSANSLRDDLFKVIGCVHDATTGEPVAGAIVRQQDFTESVATNAEGCYDLLVERTGNEVLTLTPPNGYLLPAGASPNRRVIAPSGSGVFIGGAFTWPEVTLDWALVRHGYLDIHVRSPRPSPEVELEVRGPGFSTRIRDLRGTGSRRLTELTPGRYTVLLRPPRDWFVRAPVPSAGAVDVEVTVEPDNAPPRGFALERNLIEFEIAPMVGSILGEVSAQTRPVPGARVDYRSLVNPGLVGVAVTGAAGRFQLDDVDAGDIQLELRIAELSGYALLPGETALKETRVFPGFNPVSWRLDVMSPGALLVRVTAAGQGVLGAIIRLPWPPAYATDANGERRLDGLPPATFTVELSPPQGFQLASGEPAQKTATVVANQTTTLEWTLEPLQPRPLEPVVIADDFDVGDRWEVRFLSDAGGLWTHAAENRAAGGNPGGFRFMRHTFNATTNPDFTTMFVQHYYTGDYTIGGQSIAGYGYYDPRSSGAITRIELSEDRIKESPLAPGAAVAGAFIIEQGSIVHIVDVTPGGTFNNTAWERVTATVTPETLAGSGLDLSATGAPLRFGYQRGNSSRFPVELTHGIDNFRVVIHRQ